VSSATSRFRAAIFEPDRGAAMLASTSSVACRSTLATSRSCWLSFTKTRACSRNSCASRRTSARAREGGGIHTIRVMLVPARTPTPRSSGCGRGTCRGPRRPVAHHGQTGSRIPAHPVGPAPPDRAWRAEPWASPGPVGSPFRQLSVTKDLAGFLSQGVLVQSAHLEGTGRR
jgi:hypothetical protein